VQAKAKVSMLLLRYNLRFPKRRFFVKSMLPSIRMLSVQKAVLLQLAEGMIFLMAMEIITEPSH
jgi:hypothetical protein